MNTVSRYSDSRTTCSRFTIPESDFWLRLPLQIRLTQFGRTSVSFAEWGSCFVPVSIELVSFWHHCPMYLLPTNKTSRVEAYFDEHFEYINDWLVHPIFHRIPYHKSKPRGGFTLIISNVRLWWFYSQTPTSYEVIRSAIRQAKSTLASSPLYALRNTSTILFVAPSNCPSNLARSSLNTINVSNVPIYKTSVSSYYHVVVPWIEE